MNRRIAQLAAGTIIVICSVVRERASDVDLLQGKWVLTKTNQQGQVDSQVLDIEKDQLRFQIVGADSKPRIISKGTIKTSKAGPFDLLSITDIRAGSSQDELQPVEETLTFVYMIRDGNL